ncbi:MAG TPA: BrnT family toxin [Allosphingosinicella sp.]|nr:BrnT family toxin [Allosphingosinicella sp.]
MEIEFDPAKREILLRERGLDLADAGELLIGPRLDELDDRFDYGEDGWRSLGLLKGEVVACVWVDPGASRVRVITMWKARRNEQEKFLRFWEGI